MKIALYIILGLASALLIFNLTKIDYSAPFEGDSIVGVISVIACLCAILLVVILMISRKMRKKLKRTLLFQKLHKVFLVLAILTFVAGIVYEFINPTLVTLL